MEQGARSWVPCLLHVYWSFHFAHLFLGSFALRAWWRSKTGGQSTEQGTITSVPPSPFSLLLKAAPWICLGLLFWIPGVYLEFPADPWQHYARVNEWPWLQIVTEHSYWKKSSYFLAYSLIGHVSPPTFQLRWFDVYYTNCCILLCWQYYRLARVVGLSERTSFIFVLIQALASGNNLFGFYRYYGMSSTVFAQLGAVGLTRLALESVSRPQLSMHSFFSIPSIGNSASTSDSPPTVYRLLLPCLLLLALTAFNHVQGLGIAGLGLAAVIVWRLIEWRRSMVGWLALAATALSVATVLWYPRHALLDSLYKQQGWLTSWYGFNLFQPSSPAIDRTAMILGMFGFINLVAGVVLLRRHHAVGWLTVMPVVALCLPFVAVPFANALAADPSFEGGYIIAFHRIFFAVPTGLALVVLITNWSPFFFAVEPIRSNPGLAPVNHRTFPIGLLLIGLFAFVTLPAHSWYFNRLHNILMVPPDDLAMRHVTQLPALNLLKTAQSLSASPDQLSATLLERGNLLATPGIGYVLNATGQTFLSAARKWMIWPNITPPSQTASGALEGLKNIASQSVHNTPFWVTDRLYTPGSITGHVSQHWLPYAVALEHAAQDELFNRPVVTESNLRAPQIWLEWSDASDPTHFFANGARVSVDSGFPQDRGRLGDGTENQRIKMGDRLTVRPVMRAPDGNGLRVAITIQGPEFQSYRAFIGRPSPLGGENWSFGDHLIQLRQPGKYTVDIVGTTLWPSQFFIVRYHFVVQSSSQ